METLKIFLEGRELYTYLNDKLRKVSVDEALRIRRDYFVYASLTKGGKATPMIVIEVEKGVNEYIILSTAIYLAKALKNLKFNSTYIVFHWTGAEVLINEDTIPEELFKRYPSPLEAANIVSNYVLKILENELLKISRFFGRRIRFSTGLDKVLIPCSRTHYENKYTIYIDVDEADKVLETELHSDLCIIGSPFNAKDEDKSSKTFLLSDIVKKGIDSKPITVKGDNTPVPKIVGRFEVMALLQTARYYLLTRDIEQAKSFGLNRAIFYAWIKYNRPQYRSLPYHSAISVHKVKEIGSSNTSKSLKVVEDEVEVRGKYFIFGDQVQKPEDFEKTIARKIDMVLPFELVWYLTLRYVSNFSLDILRDPNKFYKHVYEPVRDTYIEQLEKIIESISKDRSGKAQVSESQRKQYKEYRYTPPIKRITEYIKNRDQS
jgi:hypothetical protein